MSKQELKRGNVKHIKKVSPGKTGKTKEAEKSKRLGGHGGCVPSGELD